eukprot:COSAG02_NODE_8542_length_2531_cov_63.764391_5_plen_114_part_01
MWLSPQGTNSTPFGKRVVGGAVAVTRTVCPAFSRCSASQPAKGGAPPAIRILPPMSVGRHSVYASPFAAAAAAAAPVRRLLGSRSTGLLVTSSSYARATAPQRPPRGRRGARRR